MKTPKTVLSARRVGVNVVSLFEGKKNELEYTVLLLAVFKIRVWLPQ